MKKNRIIQTALWALIIVYGALCVFLYYRQTFHVEGMPYESDLPYHISMAVDDHWFYSLTAIFYQLFYLTPFGNFLTALFLGCVTTGTIGMTFLLFREITDGSVPEPYLLLFGFLVNIAMPFFVRAAHYQRYIGYQSPSIWHNSTYICMKFCGILTLLLYPFPAGMDFAGGVVCSGERGQTKLFPDLCAGDGPFPSEGSDNGNSFFQSLFVRAYRRTVSGGDPVAESGPVRRPDG